MQSDYFYHLHSDLETKEYCLLHAYNLVFCWRICSSIFRYIWFISVICGQVEAKESAIRAKELEQQQAEKERQKLKDELAQERLRLMKELESVRNALAEKEMTNALLGSELKEKEDELHSRLVSNEELLSVL